jgi:hypothetical protein
MEKMVVNDKRAGIWKETPVADLKVGYYPSILDILKKTAKAIG